MVSPTEPPPSHFLFPRDIDPDEHGIVAVGGDLTPSSLLAAYRNGLFPMFVGRQLAWYSPDPRGILPLDGLRVTRSLRRSLRRYRTTVDAAFDDVVVGCADQRRPAGWINQEIRTAYRDLFDLGWAHSVEVWAEEELVGGLYGVSIGAFFAGESMFHRATDASKVALHRLVGILAAEPFAVLDVQWLTDHLSSLGAVAIDRQDYLRRLDRATVHPAPAFG